jgi:hypothetical protein
MKVWSFKSYEKSFITKISINATNIHRRLFILLSFSWVIMLSVLFRFTNAHPLLVFSGACLIRVIYACLRIVVSSTYCVLSLFYFHRLVYPMLPVYLDYTFLISAFGLLQRLVYSMLPVYLDCTFVYQLMQPTYIDGCLSFCLFLGSLCCLSFFYLRMLIPLWYFQTFLKVA